jgi:hypothetical protein
VLSHFKAIRVTRFFASLLGVIFFAGAIRFQIATRARQKSVTPKKTGEHCTEIELGCASILESFFGSFCSQKEQFYSVNERIVIS